MRVTRFILSLAAVGVLAGAAFASAARLGLNSQGLQAGNTMVMGCQGDQPVNVFYDTRFDVFAGEFVVDGAMLDGVSDTCPDGTMFDLALLPADPALGPLFVRCEMNPGPIECEKDPGPTQLPAVQLNGVAALMKPPNPSRPPNPSSNP
jgi:hypothetical protein